jgi:hypothetical protein
VAPAPKREAPKREAPKPQVANRKAPVGNKKDNPYARPFGRLTSVELEKNISDAEAALANCQERFADPDSFKDPAAAQKIQKELKSLQSKLAELEKEYFTRQ